MATEIVVLTDVALITCVLQHGNADVVVKAAQDAGAQGATVFHARGTGVRERLGILGVAVEAEKEVINIVVAAGSGRPDFRANVRRGKHGYPRHGFYVRYPARKSRDLRPRTRLPRNWQAERHGG